MKLHTFFERIGYVKPYEPTLAELATLQRRFLLAIPFENLDIHQGKPIDLSPEAIFTKIVDKHRGGICYETNMLFHDVLKEMGYHVTMIAAKNIYPGRPLKGPYDHMALMVLINGKHYLVDVGSGRTLGDPIPIISDYTTKAEGYYYRITLYDDKHYALMSLSDQKVTKPGDSPPSWRPRYIFTTNPQRRTHFYKPCHYVESSAASPLTQRDVVSIVTDYGRATLLRTRKMCTMTELYADVQSGGVEKRITKISEQQFLRTLGQPFGILLGENDDRPW